MVLDAPKRAPSMTLRRMMTTGSWTTNAAIKRAVLIAAAFLVGLIANLTALEWSVQRTEAGGVLTVLTMSPLTNTEPAGSDIEVDILIDDITDFGAYELDIAYDPNVLQFKRWEDASFLVATGRAQVCQGPSFPSPGIVVLTCSTADQGGPQGTTGSGSIGELTFSTSCSGQSMITFSGTAISDTTGAEILHRQTAGSFVLLTPVVSSAPCSGETPTPEQPDEGSLTPPPTSPPPPTHTPSVPPTPTPPDDCGDANGDGVVGAVDAALLLFKIAGLLPNVPNPSNADVDGNGQLDSIDVLQILQVSAGLIGRRALNCR